MPDRLRARAALVALLVLLTIAGIRAAGPAVGLRLPARPVIIVIGCVLEAVLAGLLVMLRWRRGTAAGTGYAPAGAGSRFSSGGPAGFEAADDLGARIRPWLNGVLITGLIAIPVVILLSGLDKAFKGTRTRPVGQRRYTPTPTPRPESQSNFRLDVHYIQYGLFAILLIALIVMLVVLWRKRPVRSAFGPADDEMPDTPAELARAVDSGRQALRELDDARAAIIRCYLAMEQSFAEAGAARGVAETPDELLARAVANGLVGGAPASRLTALFYEARFSTHPMPASRRDDAEQALADLASTLPDSRISTGAGTSGAAAPSAGPASDQKAGGP